MVTNCKGRQKLIDAESLVAVIHYEIVTIISEIEYLNCDIPTPIMSPQEFPIAECIQIRLIKQNILLHPIKIFPAKSQHVRSLFRPNFF